MKAAELVPLALRILSACTKGVVPDRQEVEILRQHAAPGEADLDIDLLACAIIRRETERELAASRAERNEIKTARGGGREKIA